MPRTKMAARGRDGGSSSRPPPPPSDSITMFSSSSQKERYEHSFLSREVLVGRYMDMEFFESIKFPYLSTFQEFGWMRFLKLHRDIMEDLVRVFYSNGSNLFNGRRSDEKFRTNIGTNHIEINVEVIHNVFGIPLGGEGYSSWTQDYVRACQEVYEDDSIDSHITDTTRMNLHTRLLHLIVCQMLIPRNGNFSQVTRLDLWMMQCIKAKRRPNLCIVIVNQMIEAFIGKIRSLPYGMGVSQILDTKMGGLQRARRVYLNPAQHLNGASAIRFGFICGPDGEWSRGVRSKKRRSEDVPEDTETQGHQAASAAGPSSSSHPPSSSSREDDLILGLAEVKADVAGLRQDVRDLRGDMHELHAMFQTLLSRLPDPSASSSPPPDV